MDLPQTIETDYYGNEPTTANREYWFKAGRQDAIQNMTVLTSKRQADNLPDFTEYSDMVGFIITFCYWYVDVSTNSMVDEGCTTDYIEGAWKGVMDCIGGYA